MGLDSAMAKGEFNAVAPLVNLNVNELMVLCDFISTWWCSHVVRLAFSWAP